MSGDETATPREQVLFLARAESRSQIVKALMKSKSATQRELRNQLDAARTTVSRSLQSLTKKGWVEKVGNAYRLTHTGHIIAEEFTGMLDAVNAVEELEEFYRWYPADIDAPDFLDVSDIEVTYSTDAAPYAPARKQSEILLTANRLRILLPATDLESTELIAEQVTERGLDVETVVSPDVEAVLDSDEFVPLVTEMVKSGHSKMFVARDALPFYLGLADNQCVQIGLVDDDGLPRALLETKDETIREWAERLYQDHLERARQKSAAEL